jgi:hypothetical protein
MMQYYIQIFHIILTITKIKMSKFRKINKSNKKLHLKREESDPDEKIVFSRKTLKQTRIFNEDYEDDPEIDYVLKKFGYK